MSMKGESSMTRFEFYDDRAWFGRRQKIMAAWTGEVDASMKSKLVLRT